MKGPEEEVSCKCTKWHPKLLQEAYSVAENKESWITFCPLTE